MNNLLTRLKKVEQSVKQKKSVIRFITPVEGGFIISESSKKSEIGFKLNDLNSIESLNEGKTITFIEDIRE